MLSACARIIVRHSYLIIFLVSLISTVLTVIPLVCHEIPSFTDPILGFETRGTTLAARFIAWENLLDETRPSRSLAVNPQEIEDQARINRTYHQNTVDKSRSGRGRPKSKEERGRKKYNGTATGMRGIYEIMPDRKNPNITDGQVQTLDSIYHTHNPPDSKNPNTTEGHIHYSVGVGAKSFEDDDTIYVKEHTRKQWKVLKDMRQKIHRPSHHNYASGSCGSPVADFAHLVVTTKDNTSLLSFENIEKLCSMQSWLLNITSKYYDMCQRQNYWHVEELCCPMWSVPNYIALISGKDTCINLTRQEVNKAVSILKRCAVYFHNFSLMATCEMKRCRVPNFCTQYDAVYNLLFYLLDANSFSPPEVDNDFVKNVMIFLPLPASSTVLPYYDKLLSSNLSYDNLIIPAMDFGLKNTLFDLWVVQDTWLIALGGLFVFLSMWIYTKSLILTVLLFTAITYSLGIAYFLYVYVYNLEFFPFMNLLVIVIVIGIGADDAFLFVKVWDMVCNQLMRDNVPNHEVRQPVIRDLSNAGETLMIQIIEETLKHSVVAIFMTSLTTAVAFFASYVSYIPAINCFSVFAGTAVLVNFFLMISLLPASVYLVNVKLCKSKRNVLGLLNKAAYDVLDDVKVSFNTFIMTCVTKLYILWIILLGGVGIGSIVVVFYYPGLQLPDSRQFQLFQKSHPFEQYDMHYRDEFLFERFGKDGGAAGSKMPIRWVWGIKAIDNGNHMNPSSIGHLVFDNNFTISEPSSQVWLLDFCTRIKAQPFYQPTLGPLLPNCFIESFKVFMSRRCIDFVDRINRSPCCEVSTFPYKKEVFNFCIIKAMESLYMTPRELFIPGVAGPKFLRAATPPTVAALVVEFESVVPYSMSYSAMDDFFVQVENWTQRELNTAPPGMQSGWFLSDLQFYDLQKTLASGTVMALLLSAGLGFVVLVPATMSYVVSICALSAMIFSSTVTIAILVLNNWKLNVLESVAISTSAGLAVDFSLHYALSYKNAKGSKLARVKYALSASTGPTAAAALTTGFAGIFLLGSKLLPYSQIGTFLALIMSVSWVYATFFLCSLLRLFGSSVLDVSVEERKPVSRVSSICSGVRHSESHELDHLADSNRTNVTFSHSPSSVSATTVVLHDDYDHAPCPVHNHSRLETIPSLSYYVDKQYDYD